jgi:hypothetical protein
VVGIPETATTSDGLHAVETETGGASGASRALQRGIGGDGVDVADRAVTAVTREDLVAKIARVGAQAPLVNTVVAAEGTASPGDDLQIAPAAERKSIGPGEELVS